MKKSHFTSGKLLRLFLILFAAALPALYAPQKTLAAKTTTVMFVSNSTKAKIYDKKFKLQGTPYNTSSWKKLRKGWYTYKINSKTKYRQLVNTETGKTKKLSKKTALKNLKKKNYIAAYITFDRKGVVTKVLFGV